jgi:hypothetical protein
VKGKAALMDGLSAFSDMEIIYIYIYKEREGIHSASNNVS